MSNGPDLKLIKKKIKSLNIPREYWGIDLDSFFAHQYNIYISIRETAGKTTQSLILGMVLNKLYPDKYQIEYLRNDNSQVVRANVENLFNTVSALGYISKIYEGKYDSVTYKTQSRKFFLVKKDEDGSIIDESPDPICVVHSLETALDAKSGYTAGGKGNFIVLDEFQDTKRATFNIFPQFLNYISTIGRPLSEGARDWLHVLLIGNNTDTYNFYFDEFMINEEIPYLKFGGSIEFKTEYGVTGVCRYLELSETQKERIRRKDIPFLGFPSKKAAAFTGLEEWAGETYKHINFDLNYDECRFRRAYIKHRGRFIQIDIFKNEEVGQFAFLHFANEPKYEDNLIFTIDPERATDIYGFGKYEKREKILKLCKLFVNLLNENRVYYASNKVGSLTSDFIKNIK